MESTDMLIGVPREIKNHEYRIGLTPAGVGELVRAGHEVLVETRGGASIGFEDDDYRAAGASVADTAERVFKAAEMIVKVKEPQPVECEMLAAGQILFTYLHLAPDPRQTELLVKSGVTAIAYETVTDARGTLPLLAPMSEVAGRMAIQAGAFYLEKENGGLGVLLGGVPGVEAARVLIIGGGVVGENSARMAVGLGAKVSVLDRSHDRLKYLDSIFAGRLQTIYSTAEAIEKYALEADLVVGAVLIPGAAAPRLISRDLVSRMKKGAVMVDVAIDQGGCFETSRPTTHQDPVYAVDEVIHYCVANMPGGVARTSTMALTHATLPFAVKLADRGLQALVDDPHLRNGLNVHAGMLTCQPVAEALGYDFVEPLTALARA
jgi:alanine dehydrogenase